MNKKEFFKQRIDKIAKESFNNDQKEIAKKIIDQTNDNDLDAVWGLISQRVKTGFVFDEAPEINHNCVAYIKENEKFGVNLENKNALEHALIIGENYDALKNLVAMYTDKQGKGLVDVVYIDPPYNTEKTKQEGNDYKEEIDCKNKFIYRDKYTRDGWLNMMNERLKLAKKILSDKGVMFISIDDCEQSYLKVLLDNIFGEENFVANLPRLVKKSGKTTDTIAKNHDYLLIVAKNKNLLNFADKENERNENELFKDQFYEERGAYRLNQCLDYDSLSYSKSMDYPLTIDGETFYPGGSKEDWEKRQNGQTKKFDWTWRWSPKLVEWGLKNGFIVIKNGKRKRIYTKSYTNVKIIEDKNGYRLEKCHDLKSYNTLEFVDNIYSNDNAKKELRSFNILEQFDFPKPSTLINTCLKIYNKSDAIVLDFFAGSGTTGQAVMELNEEDGGNRKFILVTNNENNIAKDITRERLYRIIKGVGSKGEDFEWTYSKDKKNLDGNSLRVFDIVKQELNITEIEKAEKIKDEVESNFAKLKPDYIKNSNMNIYNVLSSLTPYKDNGEE
ncbi:MAG: site-specific DNA-methyltransferase [Clostridiales bacterium]|nr:site-specific DNA-methyltransferase [Clostridiales bacterium]